MKPLLIYDGECAFCVRQARRWKESSKDAVDIEPFQTAAARFPEKPYEAFTRAVQFVDADGKFHSGAEAVFACLALSRGKGTLLWAYRRVPGFKCASDAVYGLVSRYRPFFSRLF